MKKKFIEDKKFRLIAVFLVTVLIVGGFSFAWFWFRHSQQIDMSVSNFKAEPVCSFEGVEDISDYTDENGLIILSTNNEAANYIGNFRVKIDYSGDGAGYLRVRMVHKFTTGTSDVAVQHPANIPYATSEVWYDNRSTDYCYYYKDVLDADSNDTENSKSVELITGLADSSNEVINGFAEADSVIRVAVEADMVQINRYPQIWGMNSLPWK